MREHKNRANPNSIYIPRDLLKNIFLRLPLKPLLKFKTVSKEWRSVLESKSFVDMHLRFQKSGKTRRKILIAQHCDCDGPPNLLPGSRFVGDEEFVYLHCNTRRPFMSCDGLVCIPEPGWVNVLNLATRQLLRFPSGPDPVSTLECPRHECFILRGHWTYFPGYWSMGFGRDKVSGSYKVVRMFFDPSHCDILDVDVGKWRKLSPPPYEVHVGRRSAYVNGTIYWFEVAHGCKILALDLHTEEFHDVSTPYDVRYKIETEIMSVEDRLSMVTARLNDDDHDWKLEIWSLDAEEERWSKTYFISLAYLGLKPRQARWYTHVTVSMQGDVLFYENGKRLLYKHYPLTNTVRQIFPNTCDIICPYYLENLVRFQTDHVTTISAYIKVKNAIASALGISLGVDNFLCPGKEWVWCNQMKMLVAYLFVHVLWSLCTGAILSLPMLVWLGTLELWDIIKFMVMILVFRLVIILSSLLIVRVVIVILMATGVMVFSSVFDRYLCI